MMFSRFSRWLVLKVSKWHLKINTKGRKVRIVASWPSYSTFHLCNYSCQGCHSLILIYPNIDMHIFGLVLAKTTEPQANSDWYKKTKITLKKQNGRPNLNFLATPTHNGFLIGYSVSTVKESKDLVNREIGSISNFNFDVPCCRTSLRCVSQVSSESWI